MDPRETVITGRGIVRDTYETRTRSRRVSWDFQIRHKRDRVLLDMDAFGGRCGLSNASVSCDCFGSLRFDPKLLDDGPPFCSVGLHDRIEHLRRLSFAREKVHFNLAKA